MIWPTFADIEQVLYELTSLLYSPRGATLPSFQVESPALLESALGLPHQPYYETFADKLAALVRSIACNHALVDGNKRLAMTVLHSTLLLNGYAWLWSSDDAANAILRAARGDHDFRWMAEFIRLFTVRSDSPPSALSLDELLRGWPRAVERGLHQTAAEVVHRLDDQSARAASPGRVRETPAAFVVPPVLDQMVDAVRAAASCIAYGHEMDAEAAVREALAALRVTPRIEAS